MPESVRTGWKRENVGDPAAPIFLTDPQILRLLGFIKRTQDQPEGTSASHVQNKDIPQQNNLPASVDRYDSISVVQGKLFLKTRKQRER